MKIRWRCLALAGIVILDLIAGTAVYRFWMAENVSAGAVSTEKVRSGAMIPDDILFPDGGDYESGEKLIALTFDDGPHPVYTPKLLEGLKKRGIHASFFLIGKSIEGNEEIVKQMQEEGHLIGNHGYAHIQLNKETTAAACDQIRMTNSKIFEVTGQLPAYIRPPFGSWSEQLEGEVPMTVVLWDVDPLDWKLQNSKKVVNKILKKAEPGDIILLHDVFDTSVDAAFEVIDTLMARGYTFVTVDELLVD